MSQFFRRGTYSARAYVLALFIVFAMALGGGGSPNPVTEVVLEMIFVLMALVWLWRPGYKGAARSGPVDPGSIALVVVMFLVPLIQLVPLPPSIWAGLPGRENEVAALSLIGAQSSWRPVSLSPGHTVASLLAIVPPAFCLIATARLEPRERRLVLLAILLMALATCLLGAVQLTTGGNGLNLYPQHHVGWITGFEANRNAAADVMLIGILALAVLAAPHLAGNHRGLPLGLSRRSLSMVIAGLALLLLTATVMTGSRAGVALLLFACPMGLVIVVVQRSGRRVIALAPLLLAVVSFQVAGLLMGYFALSRQTAISRVVERFSEMDISRAAIWQDTWFALKQYWPIGFGMGGFEDAMLPAERLEYLSASIPNRAHNDFLEIGLEAGALGYAIIAFGIILCITIAWKTWRDVPATRPQVIFGISVLLLIALHSSVDYPLRCIAVACLTGVAGGMIVGKVASEQQTTELDGAEKVKGLT